MTIMYITLYNVLNDQISNSASCQVVLSSSHLARERRHGTAMTLVMVKVPKSPSDDSSTQVPEAKAFSPTGNIQNTDIPYWEKKTYIPYRPWHFFESMILRQTCRFGGIWHSFPGGYIICIYIICIYIYYTHQSSSKLF